MNYTANQGKMDQVSMKQQLLQQLQAAAAAAYGETLHFNPISLSFCLFLFFLVLLKLFKRPKLNFPPSPPKLPIIGNLHQLGLLPHQSLAALSKKYGPLMLLKLGQSQTLVVSSAEMAREVMKTHDIKFSNRHQTTAAKILLYGCQDVGFAPYGEQWKQGRKLCALGLLSAKRVESFQFVREEEVSILMSRIQRACAGGRSVGLRQLFHSTANNIICRCVLGEKFEDQNGKSRFGDVSRKYTVLLMSFCVGDLFPALRWIDNLRGFIGELKTAFKTFDAFFEKVVEEHKEKMNNGHDQSTAKDFVDIMLQLQRDNPFEYHFSKDNLKAILLNLIVAGTDTTAVSLEWTMVELMRNPSAMKKVQEELRRVVGKKLKIEMNDIDQLDYMKCVIKESLRLHPPAPFLVPRETSEAVDINGYHIPSKVSVFINAWAIQRDPKIWENPNEFIPERFINNPIDLEGQDFELIPFGSGRRNCAGTLFGMTSLRYALANLLYWFDWKFADDMGGGDLDMGEENGLSVCKKIPLHLTAIPYM